MCHKPCFCCMNAKGKSLVLGSTVQYSHFSRWSTTNVQKENSLPHYFAFQTFSPTWRNMCPVSYVLLQSWTFHQNAVIMAKLFIWHWIKGDQECVCYISCSVFEAFPLMDEKFVFGLYLYSGSKLQSLFIYNFVWWEGSFFSQNILFMFFSLKCALNWF